MTGTLPGTRGRMMGIEAKAMRSTSAFALRAPVSAMRVGQSTLEYALFIGVTASALVAMSVYVRRSIQANLKMLEERINAEAVP